MKTLKKFNLDRLTYDLYFLYLEFMLLTSEKYVVKFSKIQQYETDDYGIFEGELKYKFVVRLIPLDNEINIIRDKLTLLKLNNIITNSTIFGRKYISKILPGGFIKDDLNNNVFKYEIYFQKSKLSGWKSKLLDDTEIHILIDRKDKHILQILSNLHKCNFQVLFSKGILLNV